nr:MAG TPA: hypothetical protein [Caudoviricetes sp.]
MKRQSPCIHYGQIRSDAGFFCGIIYLQQVNLDRSKD